MPTFNPNKILFHYLSLAFGLSLIACSYKIKKSTNVPPDAFWAGGPDGGNWYVIYDADSVTQTAGFKIYNDFSGELISDRVYKLQCEGAGIRWNKLQEEINAFDGEKILLLKEDKNGKHCYFH